MPVVPVPAFNVGIMIRRCVYRRKTLNKLADFIGQVPTYFGVVRLTFDCLSPEKYQIGILVTPALGNVPANFGFICLLCTQFQSKTRTDRQTDKQDS